MNEEQEYLENKGLIFVVIENMHLYWKNNDEHQGIIDAGTDGLLQGIRTYNKDKGKKSTYYYTCIKNEICKSIYTKTRKKRTAIVNSLNTTINDEIELLDLIPSKLNVENDLINNEKVEILNKLVDELPIEKDREVIRYKYGLKNYPILNDEQIAKEWGVSKTIINRRGRRALVQLWLKIRGNEKYRELFEE